MDGPLMLMKATEFANSPAEKKAFNFNDIEAEASRIMAEARREREDLLIQARQEIERQRQEAQDKGYREGYEQGLPEGRADGSKEALEQARQEFSQRCDSWLSLMQHHNEQFEQTMKTLLFEAEQSMVELAIRIAEKVIKQTGLLQPEVATENVKKALELVAKSSELVVRVHPQDIDYLKRMTEKANEIIGKNRHISFIPDETIEPGGCVLVSAQGKVDGQLETQINRIVDELLMREPGKQDQEISEK